MPAVVFDHPGEPADVLCCADGQPGELAAGHVRVRMLAAPINPSDVMFIRGVYGIEPACPQSPGFEGVGVVEEANAGLFGRILKGRRVVVLHPSGGTWAAFADVPAKRVIPIGDSVSVEEAATFFVNPATAWVLCREVLNVPRGGVLLQSAGASNLGRMIVRLGRREGFRTVSIVRREEQRAELLSLGADGVIVFDIEKDEPGELANRIAEAGYGGSIRHAIDPVGGRLVSAVLNALGPEARLILFGSLCFDDSPISPRHMLTTGQSIEGFWLSRWMESRSLWQKMSLVRTLKTLKAEKIATTGEFRSFAPQDVQQAVSAALDAHSGEKVLLRFDASA